MAITSIQCSISVKIKLYKHLYFRSVTQDKHYGENVLDSGNCVCWQLQTQWQDDSRDET